MWMRMLVNQVVRQAAEDHVKNWLLESPTARVAAQGNQLEVEQLQCDVLMVFGSQSEAGGWVDTLESPQRWRIEDVHLVQGIYDSRRVLVLESQPEAAIETRLDQLLAIARPQCVLIAGFAVGLDPELRRAAIVVASRMLRSGETPLISSLDFSQSEDDPKAGVFYGPGISQTAFPKSQDEREKLYAEGQPRFCDPDGYPLAAVAERHGIPWAVVRILTEPARQQPSLQLEALLKQKTVAGKLGAAVSSIWNEPASAKELWRIQEDALKASDRLAKFLRLLLPPSKTKPGSTATD